MADIEALVVLARKGDRDAFNELVELTYADAYTLAYRLTGSDADACDVVQDVYVRAFKSIGSFRGDARFSTWLYRIVANCASTHMSKGRRHRHELLEHDQIVVATGTADDPQFSVDNGVLHRRLVAALEKLPRRMREVVVLRDVYDLTHEDIANELDISVTAAKVRLHRARKRLRELVGESNDSQPASGNTSATEVVESKDVADDAKHHAM